MGFASQIPVFLFAPLGGIVADRFNRKHIVICTQIAAMTLASIFATLTLTHTIRVPYIFVLGALLGVVNAFDIPARQSFLVDMVGKEDLMNAIALNSSMFNGARIIGPAIAGISGGPHRGRLVLLRQRCQLHRGNQRPADDARSPPVERARPDSPLAHLLEGFRFVKHTAPIRALLLLLGLISFVGMPYTVLMPVFADQILHGGRTWFGNSDGRNRRGRPDGRSYSGLAPWRLWTRPLGGICVWVFRTLPRLFSWSRHFWLSAAILVPVGFSMMLEMSSSNTLIRPWSLT